MSKYLLLIASISGIITPPTHYSHPFVGTMIVQSVPYAQVAAACGGQDTKQEIIEGCSWFKKNDKKVCYIVLPNIDATNVNATRRKLLYKHERAHCNGWPADHNGMMP